MFIFDKHDFGFTTSEPIRDYFFDMFVYCDEFGFEPEYAMPFYREI